MLNQIYKYAVSYEMTQHNIISDINYKYTFKAPKNKNFATLTDEKDITLLLKAINDYSGQYQTKVALKLSVLTALRPFNIRSMEWSEVDLKNEILNIPPQKMKMKESFRLPLAKQTVSLLKEYKSFNTNSIYLFPSISSKTRCMSDNTLNTALKRLGFSSDEIVPHGFRAMFSSAANENRSQHKIPYDIIEKCLAHKDKDKIREIYNRAENLAEMKKLMQWWANYLDKLLAN